MYYGVFFGYNFRFSLLSSHGELFIENIIPRDS